MGESFGDAYCPLDAVGMDEIRLFAAGVLRRMPLPSDLERNLRTELPAVARGLQKARTRLRPFLRVFPRPEARQLKKIK